MLKLHTYTSSKNKSNFYETFIAMGLNKLNNNKLG